MGNMKSFAVFAAVVGSALCAPAADPYTVTGLTAGPLTAAFGDLASTKRGLRPVSLEGFSEAVELPKVEVKAVEVPKVEVAAPVYYNAVHAPAVHAIHAVAPAVATVPVVQYGLQHTVQHIPQVH